MKTKNTTPQTIDEILLNAPIAKTIAQITEEYALSNKNSDFGEMIMPLIY